MKKFALYLFVIPLAFIFSCDDELKCIRASSNVITENRDLKDFGGVIFNNWGSVVLKQGPEYMVKIEGPDNVVAKTTTEIQSEILIIGAESCFNGDYTLNVEITAPEIYSINLAGGGIIKTDGNLITSKMYVEALGVGELEVNIEADTLYTSISGQTKITFAGSVLRHELISSGVFSLNAYALDTDHTSINLLGEGDCYVTAFETLDVIISGVGNVYYLGMPVITPQINGEGEIIDRN